MIQLHHAPVSTCSQKVRLVLAEKGLDYESHVVDLFGGGQHLPDYRELNPKGVVPTLIDGDRVLRESTLINEYLDDAYGSPALRPESAFDRYRMRAWTQYLDLELHPACSVVTSAVATRPAQLQQPEEDVLANLDYIPEEARRAMRQRVYRDGVDADDFAPALTTYAALFERLEQSLSGGDSWLAGDQISLADFGVVPYVLRFEHLGLEWLWENGRRPGVSHWYRRMRDRESWEVAVAGLVPAAAVEGMSRSAESVGDRMKAVLTA